jgi:hypothetical protein
MNNHDDNISAKDMEILLEALGETVETSVHEVARTRLQDEMATISAVFHSAPSSGEIPPHVLERLRQQGTEAWKNIYEETAPAPVKAP